MRERARVHPLSQAPLPDLPLPDLPLPDLPLPDLPLPDAARPQLGRRDADLVAGIVRAVLDALGRDLTGNEAALLTEVEALALTVSRARAEIAALRADDIGASHIPLATDELDAIVVHTAAATNSILEACERLDGVALTLDEAPARAIQDVTTCIYEACSFQDITGQRITKIVATLQSIERKVAQIIAVFGRQETARRPGVHAAPPGMGGMAGLLHGPQLPASAMNQSGIDALLASFD